MSRHHRAQKWSTHQPKLKAQLVAQLASAGALPCVNCGRPVLQGVHRWEVGHRHDAARGGKPTLANVGVVHRKTFDQAGRTIWPRNCNQIAGGKLGAAITHSKRRTAQDIRPW